MPIRYVCIYDFNKEKPNQIIGSFPSNSFPEFEKNIAAIVTTMNPKEVVRRIIEDKPNSVNYATLCGGSNIIVICVSNLDVKSRVNFAFLDDIETVVRGSSLYKPNYFAKVLEQKMEFYNNPKNDITSAIQQKIDDAKDIMTENIGKILDRGDNLDNLLGKSDDILKKSDTFRTRANDLKTQMCWNQWKYILMIFGAVIVIILIILMIICNPNFSKC